MKRSRKQTRKQVNKIVVASGVEHKDESSDHTYWSPCQAKATEEVLTLDVTQRLIQHDVEYQAEHQSRLDSYKVDVIHDDAFYRSHAGTIRFLEVINGNELCTGKDWQYYNLSDMSADELCNVKYHPDFEY